MSDDFINVKPKFGWFEFDLNALWRKLRRTEKNNPVVIVAERFCQLFASHGVAVSQIPQYIPQITLDKLATPETLLAALDNDVLDQSARLFKVRRQWLDGVDDQIYDSWFCYKAPVRLFENLVSLKIEIGSFPVRVLYSGQKLDGSDDREQPLALLLVEKIGDLCDEEICRYTIFGDTWDWGYPICRIQLKAMARLVDKIFESPVPLYRVNSDVLERIRAGKCVPRQYLIGSPLTEPSLEDYALDIHESAQSKEAEELPAFTYPLRLFVEAKFRGTRTGIGEVRNMVATLLDVNQNNLPQFNREAGVIPQLRPKYHYAGAIFSTSGFSGPAMDMALAHNVSLIELNAPEFRPLLNAITATADAIVDSSEPEPGQEGVEEIDDDAESSVNPISDRNRESRSRFLFALRTALRRTLETQTEDNHEDRRGIRGFASDIAPRLEMAITATQHVGQLFVGMGNGPYMLVLKADQPARFLRYARLRPVHEVRISWSSEQDEARTWVITPVQNIENGSPYRLMFRVPKPIYDWVFSADNVRRAAIHAKNLYFSNIFIFHRDDDRDLLIRLKFNPNEIPR